MGFATKTRPSEAILTERGRGGRTTSDVEHADVLGDARADGHVEKTVNLQLGAAGNAAAAGADEEEKKGDCRRTAILTEADEKRTLARWRPWRRDGGDRRCRFSLMAEVEAAARAPRPLARGEASGGVAALARANKGMREWRRGGSC
jgi:hypothetical protein